MLPRDLSQGTLHPQEYKHVKTKTKANSNKMLKTRLDKVGQGKKTQKRNPKTPKGSRNACVRQNASKNGTQGTKMEPQDAKMEIQDAKMRHRVAKMGPKLYLKTPLGGPWADLGKLRGGLGRSVG